jgi:hypothetical protein
LLIAITVMEDIMTKDTMKVVAIHRLQATTRTRLQALSLINDCYKYIMDLTTNGAVITDAIKFV